MRRSSHWLVSARRRSSTGACLPDALTPQEQRVLALLAQGASNREIATALVIGLTTVKSHVSHLLRKLGVTTRIQAIARAREYGLL